MNIAKRQTLRLILASVCRPASVLTITIAGLIGCFAAGAWAGEPVAATAPTDLTPVLQSLVDKQLVAGAVAFVGDKEKVLDLEAVGLASLAAKTPMQTNDVFWLASMTKSFTGTALMMLVDEGKVSIDDPVEKFLPEFKGQLLAVGTDKSQWRAPRHPITIKEILSHTSGLILASDKSLKQTHNLKDDVAQYAAAPLRQEPGTKYEYNNCGINTAGRIIEVVSGQSYGDFMQTRLFDPLGLKDTTFWPSEEQARRLAHSARFNADKSGLDECKVDQNLSQATIDRLRKGVTVPAPMLGDMGVGTIFDYVNHYAMPAGGLYSTAGDVGRFCQMLLNGGVYNGKRYLSEKAIKQMSSVQNTEAPFSPAEAYGLGWSVKLRADEGPAAGSFGHRGARRPVMWIDPHDGIVMVLLVERFDMPGKDQTIMYGSFLKAAVEKYGKTGK